MKKKVLGAVVGVMVMASGVNAFAGTTAVVFNLSLPGFNGNISTESQTKSTSGATGNISSFNAGSTGNVDARMIDDNGNNGSWTRKLSSGSYDLSSHSKHTNGTSVRAQFSSDLTTTVGVTISGSFKSN